MRIVYQDSDVIVCVKPPRVLSTDEPGGLPQLLRETLGDPNADVRTVHRLDRVVTGLMVLARNAEAASELSRQIREGGFEKAYLAVVHGAPESSEGLYRDLLLRDKRERKTYVVTEPAKGVQEARLSYQVLASCGDLSLVKIQLHTGRTHQIRVQFASRGWPLAGDRKYGIADGFEHIALWSHRISFRHPETDERMAFSHLPPNTAPWDLFYEK
jgi:23S rRNA pseudouridine1911/1915/1917 synthase